MKVLHIITSLGSGGAENLIKESLPIMKSKGIEPEILLLNSKNNVFEDELRGKDIKIYTTNIDKVYSPKQIFKIKKYLNKYDVIHTHLFQGQYWTAFAKALSNTKTPMVTTEHSTDNRRRKHKVFKTLDEFVYAKYDKIICISDDAKKNLVNWLPNIEQKSTVIYNGIDLEKFQNAKPYNREELLEDIKISQDLKLILMTGRLSMPKDHETLIRALNILPNDFHLVFVGRGSLKDKLVSLSEDLGVSHRIHFLGYRDDVARIMKTVDLYVQSSHWEGFGMAAVEAMASGLPVIASDVPGLAEVVKDGGLLFPKGDYTALANTIKDICTSRELYYNTVNRCKMKSKEFSVQEMVDQYIDVYVDVLNKEL